MNSDTECLEPLSEEEELERDRRELHAAHEDLADIMARTRPAAERRRTAMLRMKRRWNWDNATVAAEIGVEKGTVWKAVRGREDDTGKGGRAIAS